MEIIMILAALAAFFGFAMARAADQGDRLPGPGQLTKVPKMEKPVNLSADKKRQPSEGCRKEGMKKISM
ncbi:MAG: hypothetical protein Q4C66_05230 [Lachnospiraceae bacterium]|nr:hypothetical protein [Lachnospiraceae bacterium]